VVIGLIIVSHFAFHPLWGSWPAGPDLLSGGLLLASLGLRPGRAAALGLGLGLLEASMALGPLGPTMLVLAVGGFGGAWFRAMFYSDTARFTPTLLITGVIVIQLALALVGATGLGLSTGLLLIPVSAVVTAAVCWTAERVVGFFIL
jgi:hypothetical protein